MQHPRRAIGEAEIGRLMVWRAVKSLDGKNLLSQHGVVKKDKAWFVFAELTASWYNDSSEL